jgi:hypothetical protein
MAQATPPTTTMPPPIHNNMTRRLRVVTHDIHRPALESMDLVSFTAQSPVHGRRRSVDFLNDTLRVLGFAAGPPTNGTLPPKA